MSALDKHGYWLAEIDADPGDERRSGFHEALSKEVDDDHTDVAEEIVELYTEATDLDALSMNILTRMESPRA